MTTFNTALVTLTSTMSADEAWNIAKLTREEWEEFNEMVGELDDAHLLTACEWLVTDWEEEDTELMEMYNMTLRDGVIGYEEAWEYKLTSEELELYNSNPDLQTVEESLPLGMTVQEALTLPNQGEDISYGNINIPLLWEPELMTLRLCRYEDLSSCMTMVKPQKVEMKV